MSKIAVEVLNSNTTYSLREVCERSGMAAEQVIELVDFGIAEPRGDSYRDWCFSPRQVFRLNRALRLRRDLQINLPGLALALDLLEEMEAMRGELEALRAQVGAGDRRD